MIKKNGGTGEMAQQLRALAMLAEDPSSIPRTHMATHNCLWFQFQGHAGRYNNAHKIRVSTIISLLKINKWAGCWWCMPLIPVLGRQRQVNLCEFKANPLCKS